MLLTSFETGGRGGRPFILSIGRCIENFIYFIMAKTFDHEGKRQSSDKSRLQFTEVVKFWDA